MHIDRRTVLLGMSFAAAQSLTARANSPVGGSPAKLPAGARSEFATVNGVRLHYVTAGSGPALVLLHGWPQTWFAWHGAIERFSRSFTVIAPDLRGIGLSEKTASGYDKRTLADDIRDLVRHVGFTDANIVGHDMGGKAAYVLAHTYPSVVRRLVLADCSIPGTEGMDSLRGGMWHYGFHMAQGFPEMLTAGREREYIARQIREWSFRRGAINDAAIDEYARHYATPGGMTTGFNLYRALRDDAKFVETIRGRSLSMPVMTITGRQSVGDSLATNLRVEAPQLTSVVIENCGHFVAEEAPDEFCNALAAFVEA
ncbi:soluble epoxide hydrolase [Variibacter gotjawalensis]|uniref:Soluble epoxide hydrolase n=2 Tax=Variibacter gotjawalensis TaxID=1333996 RepID=A0A0S3Q0H9_9BRAD|nr:pimeloyl-ACP methyl ester carboxylesterase [Variibacter gotjawalensis]BAT61690.1 soluble epoxide hydrolase [Variibacter gotjawalensis]